MQLTVTFIETDPTITLEFPEIMLFSFQSKPVIQFNTLML